MDKLTKNRLSEWQEKFATAKDEYSDELANMEDNLAAYFGTRKIKSPDGKTDAKKQTANVRKMVYELIESQVDSNIPMPKVTSLIGKEERALMIEGVIRNELDRQDTEEFIDEQGRLTPILGGSVFYLEWDNSVKTTYNIGKLKVKNLHPNQLIPQPGIFKIDEMDYLFLTFEQSKEYVKMTYGVDVSKEGDESEDQPYDHMCTHIFCYYRNTDNSIGLFSWVGDTIVQDYPDYFARQKKVCKKCGTDKDPTESECTKCGGKKFESQRKDKQIFEIEKVQTDPNTGAQIPVVEKIEVDYYVPTTYPIVIHKNIAMLNKLMGISDVDMIKDQQNDASIYMAKIREKLLKGGSIVTKDKESNFEATDEELKVIEFSSPAEAQSFGVHNLQVDPSKDLNLLELNYTIGRQTLGITDSFQGRADRTATSGKGKEIAVNQTKGRLESKSKMKDFAFSQLYEKMFKFILAYTDDQVPYVLENSDGSKDYKWFDKRYFIDKDEDGNYYYDDNFVFATDIAGTLANDRQAMWQETRSNFESGAYGDPTSLDTLIMYWTTMNKLHYPCAPDALKLLEARRQEEQRLMQQQMRDEATANAFAKAKLPELMAENENLQMELEKANRRTAQNNVDNSLKDIGL